MIDVEVFGVIPAGFSKDLRRQLRAAPAGEPVELHIASPGGTVAEGVAAYNVLRGSGREVSAILDGDAFSAATLIACAADYVEMPANALMMVHEPWLASVEGTIDECDKVARYLRATRNQAAQIYERKTNLPATRWLDFMAAETYFTAEAALEVGLVDNMTGLSSAIENLDAGSYPVRNQQTLANMLAARRLVRDPAGLLATIMEKSKR